MQHASREDLQNEKRTLPSCLIVPLKQANLHDGYQWWLTGWLSECIFLSLLAIHLRHRFVEDMFQLVADKNEPEHSVTCNGRFTSPISNKFVCHSNPTAVCFDMVTCYPQYPSNPLEGFRVSSIVLQFIKVSQVSLLARVLYKLTWLLRAS